MQFLRQIWAILLKNYIINMRNWKKIIGLIAMPIVVSIIIITQETCRNHYSTIVSAAELLLKIYYGLLSVSFARQLVTHFITQRQELYRQYQNIMGLPITTHTLANLFYYYLLMSACIFPVYLVLTFYHFDPIYILNFGSFVVGTCNLSLFISGFFTDHKIGSQIVSLILCFTSFLPLMYSQGNNSWIDILALVLPNSSFTIGIINRSTYSSLISLGFTKLYLILYFFIEFKCSWTYSSFIDRHSDDNNNNLVEDLQTQVNTNYQMHPQIILIQNLSKSYAQVHALKDMSLTIPRSYITGLLGRNGAGKTTLVDILTNVTQPTTGNVTINSKTHIGICYQHQILYEELTIEEHFKLYAALKNVEVNLIEIITSLALESESYKLIKELSGGNKRKVSIGIALIGNPQILIFDEPTSSLDPLSRRQIWQILKGLRENQSSVILTSHHLDEIQQLADRIFVIEKGKLIFQGTTLQIKQVYGKGYYLSIYSQLPLNVSKCKQIVSKHIKAEEIQKNQYSLKLFLNYYKSQPIIYMLEQMEAIDGISIFLQANTLEQSFMAIINSHNNIEESNVLQRQNEIYSSNSFNRIKAVIMRGIYNFKSKLLEKIVLYNINIIIIIVTGIFSKFIQQQINGSSTETKNQGNEMSLIQGYFVMSAAYITLPVAEKENKIINVMKTRGLTWYEYWIGNFLVDYSFFVVNYIMILLLTQLGFIGDLPSDVVMLTGVSMILYAYTFTFVFENTRTANNWFGLTNTIFGMFILPIIILSKGTFLSNIRFIKFFYPYYDLGNQIFKKNSAIKIITSLWNSNIQSQSDQIPTVYFSIVCYTLIIICIQTKIITRIKNYRILKTSNESVQLIHVSKSYNNVKALSNISFSASDQRLGLLGHNGAGKSTIFDLLTCQLDPDEGQIYVEGVEKVGYEKYLQSVGVCYQMNALWSGMKTEQIIDVFCMLVGIERMQEERNYILGNLQFQHNNKRFQNLSGGNKRKVCMAVALIGRPKIRLLDECSTGLDPSSRNSMVKTIKSLSNGLTVFTTHSMLEAEDLCSKILILKKGIVIQFEKTYLLKSKYYNCYWVMVNFQQVLEINLQLTVQELRIPAKYKIIRYQKSSIVLQIQKNIIKLSRLFGHFSFLQKEKLIQSFQVSEPRLQDVYLQITSRQEIDSD